MAEIYNYDQYYVSGTDYNDLIANFTSAEIYGYGGNDTIISASYTSTIDGGESDDIIINVSNYGGTAMIGGSGNDTIMNYGEAYAAMAGGVKGDYETDDDILIGGAGVDVFMVNEFGGNDIIANYDSTNDSIICLYSGYFDLPTYFTYGEHVFISGFDMLVCVANAAGKPINISYQNMYSYADLAQDTPTISINMWGGTSTLDDTLVGTDGKDIFIVGKNDGNDHIANASQDDMIELYDVSLSDIVATAADGNLIGVSFNTGNTITVESKDNVSPVFQLSDGTRYAYNRSTAAWQTA